MAVTISPENQQRIQEQIERGKFKDADDFVRRALDLSEEIERRRTRLDAILDEADDDVEAGRVYEMTPELRARISKEAAALAASGAELDPDVVP